MIFKIIEDDLSSGVTLVYLCGFPPPFCRKIGFWLRGGQKIFIPNLIHLFGLTFPENLSSIRLMVKAVDTFRGAGASASASAVLVLVPDVIIQKTSA